MARKKKIVEEQPIEDKIIPTEEAIACSGDELAEVIGESAEHKRVREVYIVYREKNPTKWEAEKSILLEKLSKL